MIPMMATKAIPASNPPMMPTVRNWSFDWVELELGLDCASILFPSKECDVVNERVV